MKFFIIAEILELPVQELSGFTFDRLYRCLNALNVDIEITRKILSAKAKKPREYMQVWLDIRGYREKFDHGR